VLAVSSHPDAARRGGAEAGTHNGKRFIEASRAYELLMAYLLSRPAAAPSGARAAGSPARPPAASSTSKTRPAAAENRSTAKERSKTEKRAATEKRGAALFYRGPVPRRRLRLAEFLYYTGRISWQSLISALVWQRASQPRFGELARELRSLSSADIVQILGSRLRHEQTGETAQRLRLLSAAEVERILKLQRARKRPIGRYFLEKESMSSAMLGSILHELSLHNIRCGKQKL
jgi:hypothetical protein